ncbi:hypothetical protein ABDD95_12705 [Mucilaginibacter sp. PAMB04274]|uniref:hypothetical protein n=1 Tax=Mucilaginibacter sp. PAMB04274 TaxID=3138568 RepID=UPI0031F7051D
MKNDYLYSTVHEKVDNLKIESNSTYIFGYSVEDRSHFVDQLIARAEDGINFIRLELIDKERIKDCDTNEIYFLRSSNSIQKLLLSKGNNNLYVDVTGLDNRICAALIKGSIECCNLNKVINVSVLYAEPATYNIKQFKAESVFNDLSEKIEGIEPLPGFATIFPEDENDISLVALLGFEGGRFIHMLESVQAPRENVIPVIGLPGFRLEYPYVAYWGNRRPLEDTDTWRKIKFASANSLVDIYMIIAKIIKKSPDQRIKLAPIGTKPHAIGAMLVALKFPRNIELVYDNPKRNLQRTEGVGNIIESLVSKLIKEN